MPEEICTIDMLIQKILTEDKQYDLSKIISSYEFAAKAHEGQTRSSGQPYIIHPLSVSYIQLELVIDTDTICAAMLHDVVEDIPVTLEEVKKRFGQDVAMLVDGVTKLNKIPIFSPEEQQAENVRKMLLAMSQDIRVIIIKLCDRLHNMRTLRYRPSYKQRKAALEAGKHFFVDKPPFTTLGQLEEARKLAARTGLKYMPYYADTSQAKAMKLMASKLAVAGIIEGTFSEEGLAAMSDVKDLTSQMAKELALGIRDNVEDIAAAFRKMAVMNPERKKNIAAAQLKETAAEEQKAPAAKDSFGVHTAQAQVRQALYEGLLVRTAEEQKKRKSKKAEVDENQLSIFGFAA